MLREEPQIAESVNTVSEDMYAKHVSALRRDGDGEPHDNNVITMENRKNLMKNADKNAETDKTVEKLFAPIFRSRLRDVCFKENTPQIVLDCHVIGNPTPKITFFHHESAIKDEDRRHKVVKNGDVCSIFL